MKRRRSRPNNSHWTSAELKRLRECYRRMSAAELEREFPRHTIGSIRGTARARGFCRPGGCAWSAMDWMAAIKGHVPKCDLWGAGVFG